MTASIPSEAEAEPLSKMISAPFWHDPKFLVAAILGGAILVIYRLFGSSSSSSGSRRSNRGVSSIVLVGPSDSGKTSIFAKLIYNQTPSTHPSLKPSTSTLLLPTTNKSITLIDVPGHPRLREKVKEQLGETNAAVFVLDVGSLSRNGSNVAEELATTLSVLAASSLHSPTSNLPQLLILSHKSDLLPTSTSSTSSSPLILSLERAQTILTKEMNKLKSARGTSGGKIEGMSAVPVGSNGSLLGSVLASLGLGGSKSGGNGRRKVILGEDGEEDIEGLIWGTEGTFKWEDVDGVEISWAASELKPDGKEEEGEKSYQGLEQLVDWLEEL